MSCLCDLEKSDYIAISKMASKKPSDQPPPPAAPSNQSPALSPAKDGLYMPAGSVTQGSSDVNVHFDQISGRWQYEDPTTGIEFEYDETVRRWKRIVDEDEWKQQQNAYKVAGVDEERPAGAVERRMNKKKRKQAVGASDFNTITGEATSSSIPLHEQELKEEQEAQHEETVKNTAATNFASAQPRQRVNSSLYLSRLPLDAEVSEIASVFSRYGIVSEDDDGSPRIKMYTDAATGMFKGEALLTYFKPESCQLAIQLLDGTCLRASLGQSKPEMKVEMADWSRSSQAAGRNASGAEHNNSHQPGSGPLSFEQSSGQVAEPPFRPAVDPTPNKRMRTEADKKRAAKRFARMNDKLSGWESDSDEMEASLQSSGICSGYFNPSYRVVVLKRMFTLAELEEDPSLLLDLKADIRDECDHTIGPVTSVTLWDEEPEGVVSVKFKRAEDAQECVKRMDGRYFAQRRVEAFLAESNKVRFRRSGRGESGAKDEDKDDGDRDSNKAAPLTASKMGDDEKERQDNFGAWLEGGDSDNDK